MCLPSGDWVNGCGGKVRLFFIIILSCFLLFFSITLLQLSRQDEKFMVSKQLFYLVFLFSLKIHVVINGIYLYFAYTSEISKHIGHNHAECPLDSESYVRTEGKTLNKYSTSPIGNISTSFAWTKATPAYSAYLRCHTSQEYA